MNAIGHTDVNKTTYSTQVVSPPTGELPKWWDSARKQVHFMPNQASFTGSQAEPTKPKALAYLNKIAPYLLLMEV